MLSRKYLGVAGTISLSFGLMAGCSDESATSSAKNITGGITADDIQEIANSTGITDKVSEENICLFEGYTGYYAADNATIICMDATGTTAFWINPDGTYGFPGNSEDATSNDEGNAGAVASNSSASAGNTSTGNTGSISGNTATSSSANVTSGSEQESGNTSVATSSATAVTDPSVESSSSVATGCTSEKEAYTIAGTNYYFDASQRKYYYYDANCVQTYVENQVTNSSASAGKSSASTGKSSASTGKSSASFGGNSSAVVSSSGSQVATSSETAVISSSATTTSSSGTSIIGGGDTDDNDSDNEDAKTLDGSEILVTLSNAGASIQNDNGCLTAEAKKITISCSGAYYFTGKSSDYQIFVNVANESDVENVGLYLYNLDMTSSDAPIIVANAEKTVVHLVKGTTNSLTDGESRVAFTKKNGSLDTADAVIYSKDDINFKGAGSLTLTSKYTATVSGTTVYGSGIKSSNDIKIKNGTFNISALNNGIKGKGSVQISGGNLTISTKYGDGIKSDEGEEENQLVAGKGLVNVTGGTLKITSADDGIQAWNQVRISETDDVVSINIIAGSGSPDKAASSNGAGGGPGGSGFNFGCRPGQTNCTNSSSSTTTGTATSASSKGIVGADSVIIESGTIEIAAYKDAVHSNGYVNVNGGNLKLSGRNAIHADEIITINDGSINMPDTYEALEARQILAKGGMTASTSSNDGWNASTGNEGCTGNCSVQVSGGFHFVNVGSGDTDGIDSNGDIQILGGYLVVQCAISGGMGGVLDSDGGYTYKAGHLIGFGNQSEKGTKTNTSFNTNTYYGTANIAFKPTFSGTGLVTATGSASAISDVSSYQKVTLPDGNILYYK